MADNFLRLSYSDDGGHNWSEWRDESIGDLGQYETRVVYNRLGSFRNRVFRFRITTPRRCDILGAVAVLQGTEG